MKQLALLALLALACAHRSVTISPKQVSLDPGAQQQFTATLNPPDLTIRWSADVGSVDGNGLFTAPTGAGTAHVMATANAALAVFDTATVTVNLPPVQIAVTPTQVNLGGCQTQAFSATIDRGTITWSVLEAGCGTVAPTSGASTTYTAPNVGPAITACHVVATGSQGGSAQAEADVTQKTLKVTISPTSATLLVGGKQQFTATVSTSCSP